MLRTVHVSDDMSNSEMESRFSYFFINVFRDVGPTCTKPYRLFTRVVILIVSLHELI